MKLVTTEPKGSIDPNGRRSEADDVERRKKTQRQREDEFHADFAGPFFGALPALGSRCLRMCPQRLADARPEPISLREHADQATHILDAGTLGEVLERLQ